MNKIDELKELAAPLVKLLRAKYNPHCQVIITYDHIVMYEEIIGIPVPLDDKGEPHA